MKKKNKKKQIDNRIDCFFFFVKRISFNIM